MIQVSSHQIIEKKDHYIHERMDWWHEALDLEEVWQFSTGKNIKIGIIDTGIDTRHPDLKDKIQSAWAVDGQVEDDNGHGTHVAGIIGASNNGSGMIGLAPDAQLYIAKTMNQKGQGSLDALGDALSWCMDQKVDIINLSLGTRGLPPMYVQKMIDQCLEEGIWIVAAAGNDHLELAWPASDPDVLAVGALAPSKEIASFSNYGKMIDVAMPGVSILSTYLNQRYARLSGTSMAAPIVTGALALYKSLYPQDTFHEMYHEFLNSCEDLGKHGFDPEYGNGLLHVKEFLKK